MHVLLLATDETAARSLAAAWADAAPHTTCEARAVGGPVPGVPPAPVPGPAGAVGGGVLVAGARLPVGGPAAAGPVPAEPGLAAAAARADLVVVAVDVLDVTTLHEGPVPEAARAAAPHAVPVVVLAGRSEAGRREWSAAGLSGVHEIGDVGLDRPERVARVARTWSPGWQG